MAAVDRIEEFPKDGHLWWIRWVDHYQIPHKGTATASVEVLLEPLPVSLGQLRDIELRPLFKEPDNSKQKTIRVFSGYVPRLVIGTVFQDGVEVGTIPLTSEHFDIQDFKILVMGVKDEIQSKPDWWTYPYRVINRGDYQLQGFPNSNAVVVSSSSEVLVIPCHEIFRTMYAPHSAIARALTSGPWEQTASELLDPEETGVRQDGVWQISLRREIKNHFAKILTNLWLSETGKAAANSVYTTALGSKGPSNIAVPFPFILSKLKLKVRGIWLDGSPAKFLALQITGMEWPNNKEIAFERKNSADKGLIQTQTDAPKPYSSSGAKPIADEEGIIDANSVEDPSATSEATEFYAPSVEWTNEPDLIKVQKMESFKYADGLTCNNEESMQGVSPGEEWYGESNSGSASYSAERRDPSKRFTEVAHMLDKLCSLNAIKSWSVVPHPKPFLSVGSLSVWHFPKTIFGINKTVGFSYIDRTTYRRRGALVCEIQIYNQSVYWLEIEVGANGGGFRSLIFSAPNDVRNDVIFRLIRMAAHCRGIWPDIDELILDTGTVWAEPWQHSYIGRTAYSDGRLNELRAFQAIARVANKTNKQLENKGNTDVSGQKSTYG